MFFSGQNILCHWLENLHKYCTNGQVIVVIFLMNLEWKKNMTKFDEVYLCAWFSINLAAVGYLGTKVDCVEVDWMGMISFPAIIFVGQAKSNHAFLPRASQLPFIYKYTAQMIHRKLCCSAIPFCTVFKLQSMCTKLNTFSVWFSSWWGYIEWQCSGAAAVYLSRWCVFQCFSYFVWFSFASKCICFAINAFTLNTFEVQ